MKQLQMAPLSLQVVSVGKFLSPLPFIFELMSLVSIFSVSYKVQGLITITLTMMQTMGCFLHHSEVIPDLQQCLWKQNPGLILLSLAIPGYKDDSLAEDREVIGKPRGDWRSHAVCLTALTSHTVAEGSRGSEWCWVTALSLLLLLPIHLCSEVSPLKIVDALPYFKTLLRTIQCSS